MPLFEYHCKKCGSDIELLIRNSKEQPECTQCGSKKLEKQMSVTAAPSLAGGNLPVCGPAEPQSGCGRPQCGSGCMFD
jgi:putative FmdB family regulatory protein